MTGLQLKTLLVTAASALALAACGSAEVASPGEGDFGNGGGGTPTTPTTPTPGTPAADCPTGLTNVGTSPTALCASANCRPRFWAT
jgi:hypothetical protein